MSVTLALFEEKKKIPMHTNFPEYRVLCWLVFTSFLIIFLLNIYLFVKNTLSSKV